MTEDWFLGPLFGDGPEGRKMENTKTHMKVYELGGKSMIRMVGDYLSDTLGFRFGDEIEVELLDDGSIMISHSDYAEFREVVEKV